MNTPTIAHDLDEFKRWLTNAKDGDWAEYFSGFTLQVGAEKGKYERRKVGNAAWNAYEAGLVTLVQSRNPDESLSYLAKRVAKAPPWRAA